MFLLNDNLDRLVESLPMVNFAANPEDITLPEDLTFEDQQHDGIYRLNSIRYKGMNYN